MKKIILPLLLLCTLLTSCSLTEEPQASASSKLVFGTESGLKTYSYSFYSMLPDGGSAYSQDAMDHIGVVARAESAKLILKKIQEMPENMPVMLSGDFNVDQFSPSYQLLNSSGVLQDSYDKAALVYDQSGTFNGFDINGVSKGRIDHIFLTDRFSVLKYGILTDTYRVDLPESGDMSGDAHKQQLKAKCPSDHFPVMIVVRVQTK